MSICFFIDATKLRYFSSLKSLLVLKLLNKNKVESSKVIGEYFIYNKEIRIVYVEFIN